MIRDRCFFCLHALFTGILLMVLFGAYFVEFFLGHVPCRLCYLQRMGIMLAAFCLIAGLKKFSLQSMGVCWMSLLFGGSVALRHNCLKFCQKIPLQPVVFGKSLPVWSLWVFTLSAIGFIVLLFLMKERDIGAVHHRSYKIFITSILVAALIGIFSALVQTGSSL